MLSESIKSIVTTDEDGQAACPICGTTNAMPLLRHSECRVIHDGYYKHTWNIL